ncbi:protein kinase containing Z-DNA binding domains isoform X2 [Xyrauchen texanus]|uniref:protein kinase containing Z-DNA binding domains isoform X2 n=1 Tax=Xyrauchen texanus TaxID=154827 RepID=UPI00224197B3|nr:protein kinase containing Z-DNA binding domains isoform X2 [Xyrauchen texanus]
MSVSADNEMKKICDFLRQNGESSALKIAKGVGLLKPTVNKHLYSLLELKLLNKSDGKPPVWSLNEATVTDITPALKSEATADDKTVIELLRSRGTEGLTPLKIAKEVGLYNSTLNKHLYSLDRSDGKPPVWSLNEATVTDIKPALKSEATVEDKPVIELLRSRGTEGLATLKIAKELGLTPKTTKKQLYSLLEKGEVHKSDNKIWTLCDENRNGNLQKEIKSCAQDFRLASNSGLSQNFEEISTLGEGGYGHVYKVKHKYDGKIYAVKIVDFTGKADSEVKVLARLDHPNIVRYMTCWTSSDNWTPNKDMSMASSSSDGVTFERPSREQSDDVTSRMESLDLTAERMYLYIQMEFCEGGKLTEWIQKRNLTEKQRTLEIFSEIVTGVEYIHSNNLIHRDLKPDNILFGADGKVKIGDFGLAAALTNHNGVDIERSKRKGTPQYMSPEQENQRKYDAKTDIFPLGLIWFEMIWKLSTGMERAMLWPDLRNQRFPEGFCEEYPTENKFIFKMLSPTPEDRPHAKEIKENLVTFFSLDQNWITQRTI